MSLHVTAQVRCDRCPKIGASITRLERIPATEVRRVAKNHGWTRTRSQDLCPACTVLIKPALNSDPEVELDGG